MQRTSSLRTVDLTASRVRAALALLATLATLAGGSAAQGYPTANLGIDREVYPADGVSFDRYGSGVDVFGNRAVVGAPADDDLGASTGCVYVHERNLGGAGTWGTLTKLYAATGLPGDFFGSSVAIKGGLIAVGAWGVDQDPTNFVVDSGAAYVFDNTTLTELVKLTPPVPQANSLYGTAIDVSPGLVLVGDPGWDNFPATNVGQAHLYAAGGGPPLFSFTGTNDSDQFGISVALSGSVLAIGSQADGTLPSNRKGAVYLHSTSTGLLLYKLVPADGVNGDRFGASVAIDSAKGVVAVGAPRHHAGFGSELGAVYVYSIATGLQLAKFFEINGLNLGTSVAINGEILLASQPYTTSGGCGTIYQYDWEDMYRVATLNILPGGLCSESLGTGLALDGVTAFTADYLNGSGVAPSSGTAWTMKATRLALSADAKIASASFTTTHFRVRPGSPTKLVGLAAVAFDGVPLVPIVTAGLGTFDALGQITFTIPPPGPALAGHTLTIQAAGFSKAGPVFFTNKVDVAFVP